MVVVATASTGNFPDGAQGELILMDFSRPPQKPAPIPVDPPTVAAAVGRKKAGAARR